MRIYATICLTNRIIHKVDSIKYQYITSCERPFNHEF